MSYLFVPYHDNLPASVKIKGHTLVILSSNRDDMTEHLDLLGANKLESVQAGDSLEEPTEELAQLIQNVQGGIVIAPDDLPVAEVLKSLEEKLPWVN